MVTKVDCPICARQVEWSATNRYRPFCSERCKKIDLGAWAAGDYAIPEQPGAQEVADREEHDALRRPQQ